MGVAPQEVQCIGKSKDFLYSGTGLRNAENSSALHKMCDGTFHHVSPFIM